MDKYRDQVVKFQEIIDTVREFIIYDTETTGLNPLDCDIIEISAIKVKNIVGEMDVADEMDVYINIGYPLPEIITQITGITDDLLKTDGVSPEEAAAKFAEFIGDSPVMVGYNSVSFDTKFVEKLLFEKLSKSFDPEFQLDVLTMAKEKTEKPHKLCDMAEKAGATDLQFHRSIDDCKATLKVLQYLLPMYAEAEPRDNVDNLKIFGIKRWTKSLSLDRLYVSNNANMQIFYDIPKRMWQILGNVEDEPVIRSIYRFAGVGSDLELLQKYCG